jgi:hypothetical protein
LKIVPVLALRSLGVARPLARNSSSELADVGVPIEAARAIVLPSGYGVSDPRDLGLPQAEALARALGGCRSAPPAFGELRRGLGCRRHATNRAGRGPITSRRPLYIALRPLSSIVYARGRFNHIVGDRRAGTVIAVNRDPACG